MLVLGIESSCDETGIALYDSEEGLIGHLISSQVAIHEKYGGVVPELASRDHVKKLVPLLGTLLEDNGKSISDIDLVSFTNGPGLLGPLLTGVAFAKTFAWANEIPSIEIDHLEAHIFSAMMSDKLLKPPFISLLVSGGHTLLSVVTKKPKYKIIGRSLDDSVGEVFDKVARKMGLKYPGGPEISLAASKVNKSRFKFTRPMFNTDDLNFSFSGLKTNVIREIDNVLLDENMISEISHEFQECVIDVLLKKTLKASKAHNISTITVSGGVSANKRLRERFLSESSGCEVYFPNLEFSTDNGAMIAYLGFLKSNEKIQKDLKIKPTPTSSIF